MTKKLDFSGHDKLPLRIYHLKLFISIFYEILLCIIYRNITHDKIIKAFFLVENLYTEKNKTNIIVKKQRFVYYII